jgi:transcriptional regulator with XRE-family HTH domain
MKDIEPFYLEVGRIVQAKRNENGMSQEYLGQQLDPKVTRASIANIEAGKQRVLSHTLVQLSKALGVNIVELLPSETASQITKQKSSTNELKNELNKKLSLPSGEFNKIMSKINANIGKDKT